MQEPFEPIPEAPQRAEPRVAAADEIVAAPDASRDLDPALSHSVNDAPLREIAHAFRMNAEALHSLKQMQSDLARSVKRGDRSELVLQSTRALNETFRNLTAVQRELLGRMRRAQGAGRGPLVPMMLLGLLIVVLGGVYVILDAVDKQGAVAPGMDPGEIARRERDSWKEGRRDGAQQSDREIKRLQEALDEAKERRQTIQGELDLKVEHLADMERGKRVAEMERDEFAGQVRKAQSEIVAKKALEDEIGTLQLRLDAANKIAEQAQQDFQRQRSRNAYLRERMADYGLGFAEDDPPWRPGQPAGTEPATGKPVVNLAAREAGEGSSNSKLLNLYLREREKKNKGVAAFKDRAGVPPAAGTAAGDSSVPPPAGEFPPPRPRKQPARVGAAYGGDVPGARPPPALTRRGDALDREPKSVDRVRAHLNGLLAAGTGGGGAGWTVTRIDGVSADRLGGVIMQRYDAAGRMVESIEAKDVRIAVDRENKRVRFTFREGLRYDRGRRAALPPRGMPVIMAQGREASAWNGSPLRVIKKR